MTANANQTDAQRPRISMVIDARQQWQYAQQFDCSVDRLNELGRDGWHLVGPPVIASISLGTSGKLLYVFERPMPVNQQ
jgi:hypothetical protein